MEIAKIGLLLFGFVILVFGLEIKDLHDDGGIYFDWVGRTRVRGGQITIIRKLNLTAIEEKANWIKESATHFNEKCLKKYNQCEDLSHQSMNRYRELVRKINIIENLLGINLNSSRRSKRGLLNFVGHTFKFLFGTMDSADAEKYEKQLIAIELNQQTLHYNAQEETRLLQSLNSHNQILQNRTNIMMEKITQLQWLLKVAVNNVNENEEIFEYLQRIAFFIVELCRSVETEVEELIDGILFLQLGLVHPVFISPEQFVEILTESRHMEKLLLAPEIRNYHQIIKSTNMTAYEKDNAIVVLLSVPFMKPEEYKSYEIVPIPAITPAQQVILESPFKYFLISADNAHYAMSNDLMSYRTTYDNYFVLNELITMSTRTSHGCEVDSFLSRNSGRCVVKVIPKMVEHYKKLANGKFLYAITNETAYEYTCRNKSAVHGGIKGVGFLKLDTDCVFKTEDYEIESAGTVSEETSENIYMPLFEDCCRNIKIEDIEPMQFDEKIKLNINQDLKDYSIDLDYLQRRVEKELVKVDSSDVGHERSFFFGASVLLLIIITALIALKFIQWYFKISLCCGCLPCAKDSRQENNVRIVVEHKENEEATNLTRND